MFLLWRQISNFIVRESGNTFDTSILVSIFKIMTKASENIDIFNSIYNNIIVI